jgi:replicative DNA helicase
MLNDLKINYLILTNEIKTQNHLAVQKLLNKIFELKEKSLIQHYQVWLPDFIMDSLTQGFQKSDLIILAGRPSMGKKRL